MIVYKDAYNKAKAAGEQTPRLPKYVGECIMMIAQKMATKRGFVSYSYKEEMISDAIENVIQYIHNFDPEKSKMPFAYITKITKFAFIRRIQSEKKQEYIRLRHSQNYLVDDQLSPEQIMGAVELYDNLNEFVAEFEAKNNLTIGKKKDKPRNRVNKLPEIWA